MNLRVTNDDLDKEFLLYAIERHGEVIKFEVYLNTEKDSVSLDTELFNGKFLFAYCGKEFFGLVVESSVSLDVSRGMMLNLSVEIDNWPLII